MDALIKEFRAAYAAEQGNDLAKTVTPDFSTSAEKLQAIWKSGGPQSVKEDLRFLFLRDKSAQLRMSREESECWQEIYFCYWKALGEIMAVEGRRADGVKVGPSSSHCKLFLATTWAVAYAYLPPPPAIISRFQCA